MTDNAARSAEKTRTVRPRWTWIALVVMFVGMLLVAWGTIIGSWAWVVPGLVVIAAGAGLALYGAALCVAALPSRDQPSLRLHAEHEFPVAGTMRSEAEVKRDVRRRWLGGRE